MPTIVQYSAEHARIGYQVAIPLGTAADAGWFLTESMTGEAIPPVALSDPDMRFGFEVGNTSWDDLDSCLNVHTAFTGFVTSVTVIHGSPMTIMTVMGENMVAAFMLPNFAPIFVRNA